MGGGQEGGATPLPRAFSRGASCAPSSSAAGSGPACRPLPFLVRGPVHRIMEPHHTVCEPSARTEAQPNFTMPRGDERNALADEDRNDVEDEFVDLAAVEKRPDQPRTP